MTYLYTFNWHHSEQTMCQLEMRAFFGESTPLHYLVSAQAVPPSRSAFIRARMEMLYSAPTFEQLVTQLAELRLAQTYRVMSLNEYDFGTVKKIRQGERRQMERTAALAIDGEPELVNPELLFGVVQLPEGFFFGPVVEGEAVWLKHQQRPHEYSTALGTKLARTLVNVAVPVVEGKRVIDPCCGIGTVLVEALSMGVDILGRDMNWFVAAGSRKNIAHFGYKGEVQLGPIEEVTEHFDVAIIDMPYNLFTHSSEESKQSIIDSARRIADRVVFVSSEAIEHNITVAGFTVLDRCDVQKHNFIRTVFVCE